LVQIYPQLKQVADQLLQKFKEGEFFESFKKFVQANPDATIVWRTFGVNGPRVVKKYNAECNGKCSGTDVMHREPSGEPTLFIGWDNADTVPDASWPHRRRVQGYKEIANYMVTCGSRLIIDSYSVWSKSGEATNMFKLFVHVPF